MRFQQHLAVLITSTMLRIVISVQITGLSHSCCCRKYWEVFPGVPAGASIIAA